MHSKFTKAIQKNQVNTVYQICQEKPCLYNVPVPHSNARMSECTIRTKKNHLNKVYHRRIVKPDRSSLPAE